MLSDTNILQHSGSDINHGEDTALLVISEFPSRNRFYQKLLTDKQFNKSNQVSGNEISKTQFHKKPGNLGASWFTCEVTVLCDSCL